jgi:steroid 5-alpha reductase family enzyme
VLAAVSGSAARSKSVSLALITVVYVVAVAVMWVLFERFGGHPLANVAAGMAAATGVTFVFTLVWNNGSVFDPYWSVIPPFVALYLAELGGSLGTPLATALMIVMCTWAVRLTLNWAVGWPGMHHEDWRYPMLYERAPLPRWAVQLLGVEGFPTLVIFLGCIPMWPALTRGDGALGPIGWAAAAVGILAAGLELAADEQRRALAAAKPGALMEVGLWAWCRHPNYLGEILFWVSLWLFGVAADPGALFWTALGPLAIVGLFLGASIPLIEERNAARRPGWAEYKARTPKLLPRAPSRRAP